MCYSLQAQPPIPGNDDKPITGNHLVLTAADDSRLAAYAAHPQTPARTGVTVLPDARGLHSFYQGLVRRLAEHGHHAIAIDYFSRTAGIGERDQAFNFMEHVMRTSRDTLQADVAAAIAYLRTPEIGCECAFTLGFCLGGRLSFLTATTRQDLCGVIGFYGFPGMGGPYRDPGPIQLADQIGAPVLAVMGGADEGISSTQVSEFERALTLSGVEHEIVTYPDAPHGFFDVHQAQFAGASADAWARTLDFIRRHSGTPQITLNH